MFDVAFNAVAATIAAYLAASEYDKVSFTRISARFNAGQTPDDLRLALIAAGAVRYSSTDRGESWGLVSRNCPAV